jgi:hypothetical protein
MKIDYTKLELEAQLTYLRNVRAQTEVDRDHHLNQAARCQQQIAYVEAFIAANERALEKGGASK